MIVWQSVCDKLPSLVWLLCVSGFLLLSALPPRSQAQITLDGSLGPRVALDGPNHTIPASVGQSRGPNLFHSFDQFNLASGESATFTGPPAIGNILSRVTGGSPSRLDGTIRSQIPGANFYLLNPSGVLFGPHASLDVSGSFHVSTADYLRLADGARFATRLTETSVLSVAPPVAFGFLGPQPAAITVQGSTLQVPAGATLSVIGGDMAIAGNAPPTTTLVPTLEAPGGQIQLVSVASPGEVLSTSPAPTLTPNTDAGERLGTITIANGALLDASSAGGGTVVLRGGHLTVDSSFIFADTLGPAHGAKVGIDIRVTDGFVYRGMTHLNTGAITTDSLGSGNAGDIHITAGYLQMDNAVLASRASAHGHAGQIVVTAPRVTLTGGARIDSSTFGLGSGGSITVTTTDTVSLAGTTPDGAFPSRFVASAAGNAAGAAGHIVVTAPRVMLAGGAQLDSSTFGSGPGGNITVTAIDAVTLAGTTPDGTFPSGMFASALGSAEGAGAAGHIVVTAPRVTATNGATLSTSTFGLGPGGSVTVRATEAVTLAGTASAGGSISGIFAAAFGTQAGAGNAGQVIVQAPTVTLTAGGAMSSETYGPGPGGSIAITATNAVLVEGTAPDGTSPSSIRASTRGLAAGAGNAGTVVIEAPTVALTGGGQIVNGTFGPGQGGRVTVRAREAVIMTGTSPDGALASGIRVGSLGMEQADANAGEPTQVTTTLAPDGTLGTAVTRDTLVMVEAPTVTVTGGARIVGNRSTYDITGGTRPGSGPNLFHSFARFSIGTHDTVRFSSASEIENILSRITGGQQSVIDGQLQSTIVGANLYLLNPSGVLFGPNATLDVSGSFHVSTADHVRLADGARFAAHLSDTNMVSLAPPVAFGFLGPRPAAIAIQGSTLQVPEGATLSVIGGDIEIGGNGNSSAFLSTVASPFKNIPVTPFFPEISVLPPTLRASGGQLHLVSVASAGEVEFGSMGQPQPLRVDTFERLGTLNIHDASLDVSGNKGGTIRIHGARLVIDNALIDASTRDLDGGSIDLRITADLTMRNVGSIQAGTLGAGRGADITVEAGRFMVTDGAELNSTTSGSGQGGSVTISATDSMTISGRHVTLLLGQIPLLSLSGVATNARGDGDAGSLSISTPTLTTEDGVIQALTLGSGSAGTIQMDVGRLTLTGGGQISSSSGATSLLTGELLVGHGRGGTVRINAREELTVAGRDQDGVPSGIFTGTSGSGPAGLLALSTPHLHLEEGHIESATTSDGRAGDLVITAGRLTLAGGARVTSASHNPVSRGQGGNITITATEAMTIAGAAADGAPSALASSAFGSGDAGHIALSTPTLHLEDGVIAARSTSEGTAGDIRIQAHELVISRRQHGGAITSESAGSGNAGTLTLEVGRLTLTDGAQLASSTSSTGRGGTITITATEVVTVSGQGSRLSTSTTGPGPGGHIALQARQVHLNDRAVISAESTGAGHAGNLTITASDSLLLRGHSAVTTEATQADGGNIHLMAPQMIRLRNSKITATVGGGTETVGGNITIDPQFVLLQNSRIVAQAFQGRGGNIQIQAQQVFLADPASLVSASSTLGIDGEVAIQAPVTSISGTLAPLSHAYARTTELLRNRCAARVRSGLTSRLLLRGRDGVPQEPWDVLSSPLVQAETGTTTREETLVETLPARLSVFSTADYDPRQGKGFYAQPGLLGALDLACARGVGQPPTPNTRTR